MTNRSRPRAATFGVIAFVTVLSLVVALPRARSTDDARPLDPGSPGDRGSRALVDAAQRLGWAPTFGALSAPGQFDTAATYLVLSYPDAETLSAVDAGRLLGAVRRGAGLVAAVPAGSPLGDSLATTLGLEYAHGVTMVVDNSATLRALGATGELPPRGCEVQPVQQRRGSQYVQSAFAVDAAARAAAASGPVLMTARMGEEPYQVVRGATLGAGRVMLVSDGMLLENDVLRICWAAAGPVALRALAWTAPGGAPGRLVALRPGIAPPAASEAPPSVSRSIRRALTEVPAGRGLAQALGAALVLLAATAPRALPPLPRRRAQRRSPFEHVSALAHAYRGAGATRTAARRLAAGLRRRHPAVAGADDDQVLARIAERHPQRADDVARVRAALARAVPPAELVAVGDAVARIDRTLSAASRGADLTDP
jgi:hypothetical protein